MNPFPATLFAQIPGGNYGMVAIAVAGILIVIFILLAVWASRYTKVGPNEVLIVSGMRKKIINPDGTVSDIGFRIVKGGGSFVMPVLEKVDIDRKSTRLNSSHGYI